VSNHPLLTQFLTALQAAVVQEPLSPAPMPDDSGIERLLAQLPSTMYAELGEYLSVRLRAEERGPFDVVLALPEGVRLAEQIADRLRLPLARVQGQPGHWKIDPVLLRNRPRALMVSRELTTGRAEMEASVLANKYACEVKTLACVLERSTAPGRHRVLLLGVQTVAAVCLAHVPASPETRAGWVIERRRGQERPER